MALLQTVKRGDTFEAYVKWDGTQLSELKSQVRDAMDNLLSELWIQETGTPGLYRLYCGSTSEWPIGRVKMDIQRTFGDRIVSSETIEIPVVKDVTR